MVVGEQLQQKYKAIPGYGFSPYLSANPLGEDGLSFK